MRITITLLLLFLSITPISSQEKGGAVSGAAQFALTRKVLYTLGDDETLYNNKYSVGTFQDGEAYAFVTKNKNTGMYSFIYNGNSIATTDYCIDEEPFILKYLNPTVENGYAFTYCKRVSESNETEYYVNIGGVEEGPYESAIIYTKSGAPDSYPLSVTDISYMYKLAGKWFYNDFAQIKGPYTGDNITNLFRSHDGKEIGFSYADEDNLHYLNVDNSIFGPFISPYDFYFGSIANTGDFIFCYTIDTSKWWTDISGKDYGPYRDASDMSMAASGKFAFSYVELARNTKNAWERSFFNIDGKEYGPYQSVYGVRISNNGNFIFHYGEMDPATIVITEEKMIREPEKNYRSSVNVDGKIYGPYSSVRNLYIEDNGNFAFEYVENGESYLNINGEVYGPYLKIYEVYISDKGEFLVHYVDPKGYHINYNGDTYILNPDNPDLQRVWDFTANNGYKVEFFFNKDEYVNETLKTRGFYYADENRGINILSGNKKHSFVSNNNSVVIDRKRIDALHALSAWYNQDRNAFLWNSMDGKELIFYEYKLIDP